VAAGWGFVIAAGLSAALIVQLARQARFAQTRPAFAEAVRKVGKSLQNMLPTDEEEFRAFTVLCVTAGIVEELLYRGFLIWYLNAVLPLWAAVVVSAIVFGLGHAYQGARGIVKTGAVGLAIAGLYLLAGSLWVPMVLHAAVDILQVRMMFNARRSPAIAA
jgi:membrane protease YdiL (CAAX protease family)